jgi:hypothetical protein
VVEKLLSLITFFAAAKKVIPPPGRRLLNKQQDKRSPLHQKNQNQQKPGAQRKKPCESKVRKSPKNRPYLAR